MKTKFKVYSPLCGWVNYSSLWSWASSLSVSMLEWNEIYYNKDGILIPEGYGGGDEDVVEKIEWQDGRPWTAEDFLKVQSYLREIGPEEQ